MSDDERDDEDREAILRRRAKLVAAAMYGLSLAGCDTCGGPGPFACLSPAPCLSPPVQQTPGQPGQGQGPALPPQQPPVVPPSPPTPCLSVVNPTPMPCLEAMMPGEQEAPETPPPAKRPRPRPQPCLSARPDPHGQALEEMGLKGSEGDDTP